MLDSVVLTRSRPRRCADGQLPCGRLAHFPTVLQSVEPPYVADVIDVAKSLNADVVLLTTTPTRDAKCGGSKASRDSHCRP